MQGLTDETVGENFTGDLLRKARDLTLEVIQIVATTLRPGMTEADAKVLIAETQTRLGAPKSWHPPQIRFGKNTVLAFGERSETSPPLQENDLFFLDLGPIFGGHEGDVGRTFAIGQDPEMHRCCRDVAAIWQEVRDYWKDKSATGAELYAFARECAAKRGWRLALHEANGHRIADFPHAAKKRGSIEGFSESPQADRWILEIQIRHPERPFGAFYEDLLN